MTIAGQTVLVTGANRGIGQALVAEALSRGAERVYAGTRQPLAHAVLTGPTDTDMTRGFDIPKASPESVARAIFDGVENGEEDIFPDPASQALAESWRGGAVKALERENAAFVAAERTAA
jgi:NAD(P)-dependent dehydrogenase (short-subunit alcohol dehydrogenase family)